MSRVPDYLFLWVSGWRSSRLGGGLRRPFVFFLSITGLWDEVEGRKGGFRGLMGEKGKSLIGEGRWGCVFFYAGGNHTLNGS